MNKIKAYGVCLYRKKHNSIEVLLCKSVLSNTKWGFLKGVKLNNENKNQTAIREFYEESSIKVNDKDLENFFLQKNEKKDIGIYLVNFKKLKNINKYFLNNNLKDIYRCNENSKVSFFDINNMPKIKKKQIEILKSIEKFLLE